ncbi:MAG: NUDIX hydrolase [Nitrospirota bacterium]
MQEELLEIVDKEGNVLGVAPRSAIHGNPDLLHKVVHVLVFNDRGELLLQKRSMSKDVAPGKWDTSVGGHVAPAEELTVSAQREMEEELGIAVGELAFLYSYIHSNAYESELVFTHSCIHNGPFSFNAEEIDEVRFWSIDEIKNAIGSGTLSDNFESEIMKYLSHAAWKLRKTLE